MLIHPNINPIAFQLGPLAVHWYGFMYLVAFGLFLAIGIRRLKHPNFLNWTRSDVEELLLQSVWGVVLGGRLGYCFFYQPVYFFKHPIEIFAVWQGGMSFHGGLIGVIVAMIYFAYSRHKSFLEVADFAAPGVPLGLACGRLGNFINGELWGRFASADLPWAIVFPNSGSLLPRHPSQLYEFLLEGITLFVLLWWFARKPRPRGAVAGFFLLGYGCFRFIVEFFREPDDFLGLLALHLSMGQWLSIPMVIVGIVLLKRKPKA